MQHHVKSARLPIGWLNATHVRDNERVEQGIPHPWQNRLGRNCWPFGSECTWRKGPGQHVAPVCNASLLKCFVSLAMEVVQLPAGWLSVRPAPSWQNRLGRNCWPFGAECTWWEGPGQHIASVCNASSLKPEMLQHMRQSHGTPKC